MTGMPQSTLYRTCPAPPISTSPPAMCANAHAASAHRSGVEKPTRWWAMAPTPASIGIMTAYAMVDRLPAAAPNAIHPTYEQATATTTDRWARRSLAKLVLDDIPGEGRPARPGLGAPSATLRVRCA